MTDQSAEDTSPTGGTVGRGGRGGHFFHRGCHHGRGRRVRRSEGSQSGDFCPHVMGPHSRPWGPHYDPMGDHHGHFGPDGHSRGFFSRGRSHHRHWGSSRYYDPRDDPRDDPRGGLGDDTRHDPRGDPRDFFRGDPRGFFRGDSRNDPRGDPRGFFTGDSRGNLRGGPRGSFMGSRHRTQKPDRLPEELNEWLNYFSCVDDNYTNIDRDYDEGHYEAPFRFSRRGRWGGRWGDRRPFFRRPTEFANESDEMAEMPTRPPVGNEWLNYFHFMGGHYPDHDHRYAPWVYGEFSAENQQEQESEAESGNLWLDEGKNSKTTPIFIMPFSEGEVTVTGEGENGVKIEASHTHGGDIVASMMKRLPPPFEGSYSISQSHSGAFVLITATKDPDAEDSSETSKQKMAEVERD